MAKSRLRNTTRDMLLSLAVIGLPIAVGVGIQWPTSGTAAPPISAAAFGQKLSAARIAEPFPLMTPKGLPAGWNATSEDYQAPGNGPADWHIGYLAPDGNYVDLDQTTAPIGAFLSSAGSDATQGSRIDINGAYWQYYSGTTPAALTTLLVLHTAQDTEIVAGNAPLRELEQFARSLSSGA